MFLLQKKMSRLSLLILMHAFIPNLPAMYGEKENKVITLTDENFEEVLSSDKLVIIDFGADWCTPCKRLKSTIEKLAKDKEYGDQIIVAKLDVSTYSDLAEEFDIQLIPTIIFFQNRIEVKRLMGTKKLKALKKVIIECLRE